MACTDPRIFSEGVQAGRPENSLDKVFLFFLFFCCFLDFFSTQLIVQFTEGSNGFITEKTILFQGSRGVQHFPGGGLTVLLFPGGVQMLISIETDIAL